MYWIYILTNQSHSTLYVGVTNNIHRRLQEHRSNESPGFARKYKLNKLVFAESTDDVWDALEREKQIKRWRREKKNFLIELTNPGWEDLMEQEISGYRAE
jgi:putative endonuclease